MDPMGPDGETVLDYSVYDAIRAGFKRVVFIIREDFAQAFREGVGARFEGKIEVDYAFQKLDDLPDGFSVPEGREKPWGTTHAIRAARHAVSGPFAVINADDFYGADAYQRIAAYFRESNDSNDSDDTAPEALKESGLLWLPPTASKEPKAKSKATKKQGSTKTAKPTLKSAIDSTPKTSDITPKTSDITPKTSASKTSAQAAPSPAERVARLRVGSKTRKVVKTDGAATADAIEEQTRRKKVERELANVKLDQLEKQNEAIAQIIEGPGKYFYKRSRKASGLTGSGFVLATAAAVKAGFPAGDQGRTWEAQQNARDQPKLLAMAKLYLAEQDNNNEDYVMEDVSEEEAGYHSPTSEHEIDRCSQSYITT